jgi:alpha-galactosidase
VKKLVGFILLILLLVSCYNNVVAPKPPMGWNSYDCFGYRVTEKQVKENADYMAAHLKKAGWEYIVVDYLWSLPDVGTTQQNSQMYQSEQFLPRLNMDKYGRLLPDTVRFPSSIDSNGFLPLASYCHNKGLKFGIHIMRGIPRQACIEKAPVFNTTFLASQIANSSDTCNWINHMYGLDMSKSGSQDYLNSILNLYASWGVDFLKIDDLSFPYHKAEIEGYRKAIDQCGREILLSASPGETPLTEAKHIATNANLWRLLGDLWDEWQSVDHAFNVLERWNPYRRPGHWPDAEVLPLGRLSKSGPVGSERYCRLSVDEQYSLVTLSYISGSPLMFGGNLPENDSLTTSLITNEIAIEANQQSRNIRTIENGKTPIWISDKDNKAAKYLAVFNRDSIAANISVHLELLKIREFELYDIWNKKSLGLQKSPFNCSLKAHACAFYKLTKIKK